MGSLVKQVGILAVAVALAAGAILVAAVPPPPEPLTVVMQPGQTIKVKCSTGISTGGPLTDRTIRCPSAAPSASPSLKPSASPTPTPSPTPSPTPTASPTATPPAVGWNEEFSTGMGSFVGQNIVFPVAGVRVNAARCSVAGGLLWLNEVRDADGGHTSCMAITNRTFDHGYFEARMNFPAGNGFGAEFWLRSLDSVAAPRPEIDFIEAHPVTNSTSSGAGPTKYQATLHYPCGVASPCFHQVTHDAGVPLAGAWHTYGAEWIPGNRLQFYMDGVSLGEPTNPITADVLSANLALVLSFSVGANDWCCKVDASTPTDASMLVDWVRWYEVKP